VQYRDLTITDDGQKQMVTGEVNVLRNGSSIGGLYPARWFYHGHESEPTTEVALRRSINDDLYLVLAQYDAQTQEATLSVMVNPLVNWIWMGVGVMLIGTIVALLPERTFAFAAVAIPERAVTTSLVVLLALAGGAATLRAQHVESPNTVQVIPRTPLEKDMQSAIICMCGTCGRKRVGECTCDVAAGQRQEIADLVNKGKTRDDVIQYFVAKYGSQEVLSEPIDRGFDRLAWLFPYLIGVAGLAFAGGIALRWSKRTGPRAPEPVAPPANDALAARLDDELRDLD
jgi:cytochrome c-type biogenesis protein CcmH/NrfF